ncbi:MAG: guanylate kinase [Oscillospiraceae bacterium]|nr:guanylate kinase [Oscillospiraceae bacterium]
MIKGKKRGQLVVLSGPSGVGKGTVIQYVRQRRPELTFSISYTTRKPREGEVDHVHYHYVSVETFRQMIEEGAFLEYTRYQENYYGTAKADVEALREQGQDVLLDIEVEGGSNVRRLCPESTLIFLLPPSFEELEARLRGRKSESDEVIRGRLSRAREELQEVPNYDFLLVNDHVEQTGEEMLAILKAQECRVSARLDLLKEM